MENFDEEEKKIPDFFETRAQVRSDVDDDDTSASKKPVEKNPLDEELSIDEVPYDFRAEYKERIGEALNDEEEKIEKLIIRIIKAVLDWKG